MGDGTSNVGLGLLNTSDAFGNIDYRVLLKRWLGAMPAEWGLTEDNMTQPIRGAALPMGFNRTPHYTSGMLLVGDAGGMVNPFNGEGIAYAMESGELAARSIVQALARPDASRDRASAALLSCGAQGGVRRLLHSRPDVREGDRAPILHEVRDQARDQTSRGHADDDEAPR